MTDRIEEIKKDIAELVLLENQATRQRIKELLNIENRKLSTELLQLQGNAMEYEQTPVVKSACSKTVQRYEVKISNYAWDETDKALKIYVTLKNVNTLPSENIKCNFGPRNLELQVLDLENKDHILKINSLLDKIDPEKCTWKVKTDMVLITLAKVSPGKWGHVTEYEKKSSELRKPKLDTDDSSDPGAGLMSLMKNMYDSGDDEMKRTIAKAWHESQTKRGPI
ncbi:unnamed protein product [Callosobruchus maculatus]|uniref:Calcyclin-binding protein n=1 Tax=Callosobruchus maculatus TaxID=64391 RepID=A0A653D365_CALMS|nr:unnamed protein product [Callosobruchus maculatus]